MKFKLKKATKEKPAKYVPPRKNLKQKMMAIYHYRWFYVMFLPVFLSLLVFHYFPIYGIKYAFYEYTPFKAPTWVGWENFEYLFSSVRFWRAFKNTIVLSMVKLVLSMVFSVGLALLIDEIRSVWFRKITQTVVYIPHFISWVVVASIFTLFLSPQSGMVNAIITALGHKPIYFLASDSWWRVVFYLLNLWKETGWGTIVFIAALAGVDQEMYEAAAIDGATHWQRVKYVSIPAISVTILTVFILNLAKVLNLFDPVFVLQNDSVIKSSDVIGTYVYRMGIESADYGVSTASGLFKSVISVGLITVANHINKKIKGEGILG